jgi:hypothetical protein
VFRHCADSRNAKQAFAQESRPKDPSATSSKPGTAVVTVSCPFIPRQGAIAGNVRFAQFGHYIRIVCQRYVDDCGWILAVFAPSQGFLRKNFPFGSESGRFGMGSAIASGVGPLGLHRRLLGTPTVQTFAGFILFNSSGTALSSSCLESANFFSDLEKFVH